MRWIAVFVAVPVVVALAASTASSSRASSKTSLTITYWADGSIASAGETWTLRCNPARGTLPRPAVACRRIATAGPKLFARVSPGALCTEIYGGPQVARIVGTVAGKRVWATFSRTNGCHISRWDRLSPWLLPSGGANS